MYKNIVAQNVPDIKPEAEFRQLELFPLSRRQRPQIKSVPGASPKQRDRYRVMIGDKILGDQLTLDEALQLAKRGDR